jgi:hypothetical protein
MAPSFTREAAETIALKALAYLANSPDDMARFVNVSGIATESLRSRAAEPEFLAAVIDFLLTDDSLLMGFCATESLDSRQIHLVRHMLPGG